VQNLDFYFVRVLFLIIAVVFGKTSRNCCKVFVFVVLSSAEQQQQQASINVVVIILLDPCLFLDVSVFGLLMGLFFLVVCNSCSNSSMVSFRHW
jgi:hypothetical protein